MNARRPPRSAEWLLRWLVGSDSTSWSIVGDLREEFARAAEERQRGVVVWYWFQVARIGLRVLIPRMIGNWREGMMLGSFLQDIRYGVRTLIGAPVFTAVCVLTLAVGVGAATSLFSVVEGVLLSPLPFEEPTELVQIDNNTGGVGWYGSSPAQFIDYQDQIETLESVGGWVTGLRTVGDTLRPRRVNVTFVTQAVWPTLGVEPLLGRFHRPEDDVPGAAQTVVLSESFWRSEYGADPGIIGRTVAMNGNATEVIGVMPAGFAFPTVQQVAWLPFQMNRDQPTRGNHFVQTVARLRDGSSIEAAREELAAVVSRSIELYPENYSERGYRARMIPLHEAVVGSTRSAVTVVFGAALLLLLIASVNVANMILSRGESRRREIAVRSAMGAGRGRVVRQLFTENLLLAGGGAMAGLGLAAIAIPLLVSWAPSGTPRIENVEMNGAVALFALGLTTFTVVVFGLVPAVRAARADLRSSLTHGDRNSAGGAGRLLRRGLVVSQVALAAVLAVGAGLMIRSLDNLLSEDLGFDPTGVMTVRVDLPSGFPNPEDRVAFYEEYTRRLAEQPGIVSASASGRLPLFNVFQQLSIHIEGKPVVSLGAADDAYIQTATPGYFETMGIEPSAGRLFTDQDRADGPLVAVVNETMAARLFEDGQAIGGRVRMFSEGYPYMEVIGVIPDVREESIAGDPVPRMYMPYLQPASAYGTTGGLYVSARAASGDPEQLLPVMRRVLDEVATGVPISQERSMDQIVATSLAAERFVRALLQLFGAVAVLLACVGAYGVLSLSVAERVREIGLRKAIGASSESVLRSVLGESAGMVGVGGVIGIAVGIFATPALGAFLFGVGGWDPVTIVGVVGLIGAAGLVAAALPAVRASRVDPMVALKGD